MATMRKTITIIYLLLISSYCYSQSGDLQVTYMRNLDFQQLIPGVKKTITETSPGSGKFTINGNGNRMTVSVSFNISRAISSGATELPVVFTATQSINPNDSQPGTPFDPYSGTTLIFDDKTREYYIKIGGTVNPPLTQKAGDYNTSIIIILTTVSN
jgi:hypothetical protein